MNSLLKIRCPENLAEEKSSSPSNLASLKFAFTKNCEPEKYTCLVLLCFCGCCITAGPKSKKVAELDASKRPITIGDEICIKKFTLLFHWSPIFQTRYFLYQDKSQSNPFLEQPFWERGLYLPVAELSWNIRLLILRLYD